MVSLLINTKQLAQTYKIADCIPVISTITNSAEIILKTCCSKYLNDAIKDKSYLAKHIHYKSYLRCFIGLIPIFGNLALFIYRLTHKRSPLEIAKSIAQNGKPEALHKLALAYANAGKIDKSFNITIDLSEKKDLKAMLIMAEAREKGSFCYPLSSGLSKNIKMDAKEAFNTYSAISDDPQAKETLRDQFEEVQYKTAVLHYFTHSSVQSMLKYITDKNSLHRVIDYFFSKVKITLPFDVKSTLIHKLFYGLDAPRKIEMINYLKCKRDKTKSQIFNNQLAQVIAILHLKWVSPYSNTFSDIPSKLNADEHLHLTEAANFLIISIEEGNLDSLYDLLTLAEKVSSIEHKLISLDISTIFNNKYSEGNFYQVCLYFATTPFFKIILKLLNLGNEKALVCLDKLITIDFGSARIAYSDYCMSGSCKLIPKDELKGIDGYFKSAIADYSEVAVTKLLSIASGSNISKEIQYYACEQIVKLSNDSEFKKFTLKIRGCPFLEQFKEVLEKHKSLPPLRENESIR